MDAVNQKTWQAAPAAQPAADAPARRRILLVVDGYYPSTGGCEMQVRLLARSFAAAGHDVSVLAPHLDHRRPVREIIDGVPVQRIVYPKIKIVGALVLCARFALTLLARRRRYDAVHVHTAQNLAAVAGMLRPWLRATLAVKISGAWEFDGGILDPGRRARPYNRFFNACIKRADHIQCISEYTRTRMLAAGYPAAHLRMIPNAVDLLRFAPPAAQTQTLKVVFVGRLVPVKGLPVLLDAWREVAARFAGARLAIAGDGVERAALVEQARALGIAERVDFLGEVADVPAVLADAAVYVQPSHQEGMPNAVLEAMASGLPIVATRVSGNEDLVNDGANGLLVPPGDARALAEALGVLMSDRERARRMGEHSRAIVEARYAVPAVLDQLLAAYRQVVQP